MAKTNLKTHVCVTKSMQKTETKGVIYILKNPSFPNYVKIGYAHDLEKRLKQLNNSEAIPFAFRAFAIYEVESELTDKQLHKLIDQLDPDLRAIETFDGKKREREFYAMQPEEAYSLLECIAKISGTIQRLHLVKPEGHEVIDEQIADDIKENARRGPFRFSECGIKPGEQIVYTDNPNVVATIVDDRRIEYNGVTTSCSALAQELKQFDHPVQGTLWFKYKGETLNDLRNRLEKESGK